MTRHRLLPPLLFALSSCASVHSTSLTKQTKAEGLTYFMPRQDLLVTVTVTAKNERSASFATTEAYPDITNGYVLHHVTNRVGKSTSTIGIGASGLLTSTKATTVSGVADAFSYLGKIAATRGIGALGKPIADSTGREDRACGVGAHVFRSSIPHRDSSFTKCGVTVTVSRLMRTEGSEASSAKRTSGTGVFYRQTEPYLVTVSGGAWLNAAGIVFSPSNAPIRYLPVSRSFFADNEAEVEFTDGMVTKVREDTDGEVVGVLKLPATIVGAYFSAIGGLFDNFKNRDTKQADVLAGMMKLEMARKKYEACLAALRGNDTATQKELECDK